MTLNKFLLLVTLSTLLFTSPKANDLRSRISIEINFIPLEE